MCHDVLDKDHVYFENHGDYLTNGALRLIRQVHHSYKINKVAKLPLKKVWYPYNLDESKISQSAKNVFIVFDSNQQVYNEAYLHYLKNKFNGHLVLMLVNTISSIKSHDPNFFNKVYDRIFTTDLKDSRDYNYQYLPGLYSKTQVNEDPSSKNDLFFIGANKGRLEFLHEIAKKMEYNDVHYSINIIGVEEKDQLDFEDLHYNNRMNYQQVLHETQSTNCILEVVQEGQSSLTLRAIEAIVYNKKLITNNEWTKESAFYNPKYIQIYNNVDEIDVDFIKEKVDVDYEYDHLYSPLRLLERIEKLLG